MHTRPVVAVLLGSALALALVAGCNNNGDDLYPACVEASDCEVPEDATAVCLPKADEGFCSWTCEDDADCNDPDVDFICASFESNPQKYCFPPCDGDVCPAGFGCRSTGGGNENRKVCFPDP